MTGLSRKERVFDYLEDNVFLQVFLITAGFLFGVMIAILLTAFGFMLHWIIGTAFALLFISGLFATTAWIMEKIF